MEDNINTNEGNLTSDDKKAPILSKWWLIIIGFVMIYGFTFVLILTFKAYHDKPPIPQYVLDMNGDKVFVEKDIKDGQEIFLRYGLMDNGTIWGHGAYLGPDFPALYLHRLGQVTQEMVSWELFGKSWINLNKNEQYVAESQIEDILKQSRYDETTGILYFSPYEEAAFVNEIQMWREYFSSPENNGGLTANLISSDEELFKLTAYFSWTAWASVANRPGLNYSYTNNFPFDTTVGNKPSPATMLWSVVSLIFLLGGIGLILFILGKNRDWEWYGNTNEIKPYTTPGFASHSQKALVKFTAVVGVLFLAQTLVGGGVAHYRADPGSFYGIDLSGFFPSSLLRTWHLQLAIFWIATGFVAGGLYLARVLGGIEFKGQRLLTNLLFAAFALVIFGSLLFEWAGLAGWWDNATFWLGSQGWEYLELGRLWQILMIVGLLSWFIRSEERRVGKEC